MGAKKWKARDLGGSFPALTHLAQLIGQADNATWILAGLTSFQINSNYFPFTHAGPSNRNSFSVLIEFQPRRKSSSALPLVFHDLWVCDWSCRSPGWAQT